MRYILSKVSSRARRGWVFKGKNKERVTFVIERYTETEKKVTFHWQIRFFFLRIFFHKEGKQSDACPLVLYISIKWISFCISGFLTRPSQHSECTVSCTRLWVWRSCARDLRRNYWRFTTNKSEGAFSPHFLALFSINPWDVLVDLWPQTNLGCTILHLSHRSTRSSPWPLVKTWRKMRSSLCLLGKWWPPSFVFLKE